MQLLLVRCIFSCSAHFCALLLRNFAASDDDDGDGEADDGDEDDAVNGGVVLHNRWSCLAAGRLHTSFPEAAIPHPTPPHT